MFENLCRDGDFIGFIVIYITCIINRNIHRMSEFFGFLNQRPDMRFLVIVLKFVNLTI